MSSSDWKAASEALTAATRPLRFAGGAGAEFPGQPEQYRSTSLSSPQFAPRDPRALYEAAESADRASRSQWSQRSAASQMRPAVPDLATLSQMSDTDHEARIATRVDADARYRESGANESEFEMQASRFRNAADQLGQARIAATTDRWSANSPRGSDSLLAAMQGEEQRITASGVGVASTMLPPAQEAAAQQIGASDTDRKFVNMLSEREAGIQPLGERGSRDFLTRMGRDISQNPLRRGLN